MFTILGAGGVIGNELFKELSEKGKQIRLVSRTPDRNPKASEIIAADLSDAQQTINAVSGSEVVYLVVGLKYNLKVWTVLWPKIMRNTIEGCKRAKARLIFFDNVYMYGKVNGAMTEETPFHPTSKKGEIRAGKLRAQSSRRIRLADPPTQISIGGIGNLLPYDFQQLTHPIISDKRN
jgi:nucleoside-diphosphate-sugar epimerase